METRFEVSLEFSIRESSLDLFRELVGRPKRHYISAVMVMLST